jgi:hypothetical protein
MSRRAYYPDQSRRFDCPVRVFQLSNVIKCVKGYKYLPVSNSSPILG